MSRQGREPSGRRKILDAARGRFEQMNFAVMRWGRAKTRVETEGDESARAELAEAEAALMEVYRDLYGRG